MVSFFCPFCKHVIKAAEEAAGTLTTCDQCGLEIRVPRAAAPLMSPPADGVQRSQTPPSWWRRFFAPRKGEHPSAN